MAALSEVSAHDEREGDGDRSESTAVVLRDPHFLRNNRSFSTAIASVFDGLSEEEVVEILRRLPLKIATQCKSVSKKWLDLISSLHFARSYLRAHSAAPPQFALVNRDSCIIGSGMFRESPSDSDSESLVKLEVDDIPPPPNRKDGRFIDFEFLAASNGWLLCSYPYRCGETYYVINPLTKYQITLPPIPRTSYQDCRVGFTFCADDSTVNSFRVVRLNRPRKTCLEVDIFSSETGQWSQSKLSFSSKHSARWSNYLFNNHAIALNGKLHWLHVWSKSEIFVYDPKKSYRRLSLPKDSLGIIEHCFGTCRCEGEERRHLKYSEWDQRLIYVWELKDYDKVEWCLMHRVVISELTSSVTNLQWPPLSTGLVPDVVAFHPWDRDVVLCYYVGRCLLQYNLRLKTLEEFLDRGQEIRDALGMVPEFFILELPWWPTPAPSPLQSN